MKHCKLRSLASLAFGLLLTNCQQTPSLPEKEMSKTQQLYQTLHQAYYPKITDSIQEELQLLQEEELYSNNSGENAFDPIDDIKSWTMLGHRYALGRDGQGNHLAIYDLAYANPLAGRYLGRSLLGSIGVGGIHLKALVDLIKKIKIERGDSEQDIDPKAKAALEHLEKLAQTSAANPRSQNQEWWKKLKYKSMERPDLDQAPQILNFSDLDFAAMSSSSRRFKTLLAKIEDDLAEVFGPEARGFLDRFELRRKESGEYEVYVHNFNNKVGHPLMISNFERYDKSLRRGFKIYLLEEAFDTLIGLIPEPVTNRILGYVVDRWFDLWSQQFKSHRRAAMQLLYDAENSSIESPFTQLSEEKRYQAGTYLENWKTGLWSIAKTILKDKYRTWPKELEDFSKDVRKSRDWMEIKNQPFQMLGNSFAIHDRKILLMAHHLRFSDKPYTGFDTDKANAKILVRNLLDVLEASLDFVEIRVPLAEDLLELVLDYMMFDPDGDARKEEYSLATYLSHRSHALGENWSQEIEQLRRQRLNPFELNEAEEQRLIADQKAVLGIQ